MSVATLSGFFIEEGTLEGNSQTTKLTVTRAANAADSSYSCVVTSEEWLETDRETAVVLNVFGEWIELNCVNLKSSQ